MTYNVISILFHVMSHFFEELADERKKNKYAIGALAKILEMRRHKTQKGLISEHVKQGKGSRGKTHTELSRVWAAFRELAHFPAVSLEETILTPEAHQISDHLAAIEKIIDAKKRKSSAVLNISGPASLLAQFVFRKLKFFYLRFKTPTSKHEELLSNSFLSFHFFEKGTKSAWFSLKDDSSDVILIRDSFIKNNLSKGERQILTSKIIGDEAYSWVLPTSVRLDHLKSGELPMVRLAGSDGEINKTLNKKCPRINWALNVSDFSAVLNMLEADATFGGLLPTFMATNFVERQKASKHYLAPCAEYPKATISVACKKAYYNSVPKIKEIFDTIAGKHS